jgi:hypothetical protein
MRAQQKLPSVVDWGDIPLPHLSRSLLEARMMTIEAMLNSLQPMPWRSKVWRSIPITNDAHLATLSGHYTRHQFCLVSAASPKGLQCFWYTFSNFIGWHVTDHCVDGDVIC